jgi:hypothetical protein
MNNFLQTNPNSFSFSSEQTTIKEISLIDSKFILEQEDVVLPLVNDVFTDLKKLSWQYPNFESWLDEKVLTGLYDGTRSIIVEWREDKIAGVAILKHDSVEKKLCCLIIMPDFQNKGIGIKLFKKVFSVLGADKPLLSISEEKLPEFEKIFNYFGFEKTETYPNLYHPNTTEISYNGYLK